MESKEELKKSRPFPWWTWFLTLTACGAYFIPVVDRGLIYDRALILHGEIWRIWTGHVVHFGSSHLIWNLAVFVPVGCWLERFWPSRTRWFYGVCPLIISMALLVLDPTLTRYAGLSGLATGMLVLLAGLQLERRPEEPAWLWLCVLALVAAKIGLELFSGKPLLVSGFGDIRTVPLAHIFGAVSGVGFWIAAKGGEKGRGRAFHLNCSRGR